MMLRCILIGLIYSDIRDVNECCSIDNTITMNNYHRDYFSPKKEEEIMVISLNVNRLKTEGWKAKNDIVRDFILELDADIVALQEINAN